MLLKFKIPFKMEACGDYSHRQTKSNYNVKFVGLQSLIHVSEGKTRPNLVIKSAIFMTPAPAIPSTSTITSTTSTRSSNYYDCYLKSCSLCNKKLSLDKEVYMYRGDQGFCSIKCRDRQIVLDEMREMEESINRRLTSYKHKRHYHYSSTGDEGGRSETRLLLEDLRRRNNPLTNYSESRWAIVA